MHRRRFLTTLAGLAVAWKASMMEASGKVANLPVIVEAGRRVDAPGAEVARFPPSSVDEVKQRIQQLLAREKPLVLQFRSSLTYLRRSQAATFSWAESLARRAARSALVNFHSKGLAVASQ